MLSLLVCQINFLVLISLYSLYFLRPTIAHLKRPWLLVHGYSLQLSNLSLSIVKFAVVFFLPLPKKERTWSLVSSFKVVYSLSNFVLNIYLYARHSCLALGYQRYDHLTSAYKVTGTFWLNSFHCCLSLTFKKLFAILSISNFHPLPLVLPFTTWFETTLCCPLSLFQVKYH